LRGSESFTRVIAVSRGQASKKEAKEAEKEAEKEADTHKSRGVWRLKGWSRAIKLGRKRVKRVQN
jgi:hypothetical protein